MPPCDTCNILARTAAQTGTDRAKLIAGVIIVAIPATLIAAAILSNR